MSLFSLLTVFYSLIGITAIVVFHEFGHFLFCKLFKVYTPTFSIGMGSILCSKMFGHTKFCISAAPLGGYVEIASEKGIEGTKGFSQIPYWQKVCIMLGGITANFIFAYIIFAYLFYTGMPETTLPYNVNTTTIQSVPEGSINHHYVQAGDIIASVNNLPVQHNAYVIQEQIIKAVAAQQHYILAEIKRDGESIHTSLSINPKERVLTKALEIQLVRKPTLSLYDSLYTAYELSKACVSAITENLKTIFSSSAKNFAGPIMMLAQSSKSAQKGFSNFMLFLAIISINLGFMNLLPLPIFDGGQFVIFTIEAFLGRSLSHATREKIGIASWALALGLMILFTFRDIYHLLFV